MVTISQTGTTAIVSPTTSTTYTVTGTSADGCQNSASITVNLISQPQISFQADTTKGCSHVEVHFTNMTTGADSYSWNFGDGTTSTATNPTHTFSVNDSSSCFDVSVVATNNSGCSATDTLHNYICVSSTPTAEFTTSTNLITNLSTQVSFSNHSTGATNYEWTFGDEGGHGTEVNPTYTYDENIDRNYHVVLVAKNAMGCTDTAFTTIKFKQEVTFFVPNAFTPDGDEYNNIFQPVFAKGFDAFDYQMLIFDRWGEIIFETHDPNVGWDGTYQGKVCQDGVYVWKISLKLADVDDRIEKVGHVTLIK